MVALLTNLENCSDATGKKCYHVQNGDGYFYCNCPNECIKNGPSEEMA